MAIFLVFHITLQEGSGVIPMFQLSWSLQGHVEVRSTRTCFDHISLFRTRNCVPLFFMDSSLFQEHSITFSKIFATSSTSWHPVQPVHRVSRCRTLIFDNYFDHISLFRTRNCVPFFSWIPHSSRNILSNFQISLQPVRPVRIRFSRFIESAGVKH